MSGRLVVFGYYPLEECCSPKSGYGGRGYDGSWGRRREAGGGGGEAKGKLAEAEGSRQSMVCAGTIFLGATDPNSGEQASLTERLPIGSSLVNSSAPLQKAEDSRFQIFSKSPLKKF
jgi:hypothetical protein